MLIENLRKTFIAPGNVVVHAVDGISIGIETGKLITLLGPSGCGKTTTLRCLAGLERPESGASASPTRPCAIRRAPHLRAAERARHRHGVPVLRDLAAYDGVRERGLPAARVARPQQSAAEIKDEGGARSTWCAVGLEDRPGDATVGRPAAAPGLGPRAGARAARCCCSTSRSPTSTPSCASRCAVELKRLQKRLGITTVYVTHDQSEALALSDEIAVFMPARSCSAGPRWRSIASRGASSCADFIGSTNFLARQRRRRRAPTGLRWSRPRTGCSAAASPSRWCPGSRCW